MLSANDAIGINRGDWILDRGASRHLVNDESLLIDSTACVYEIAMADGESLRLTRVGSVASIASSNALGHDLERTESQDGSFVDDASVAED